MVHDKSNRKSFLRSLLRSTAGNTLALGAAAIIPLAGMIGGGLDMSRAYLVKARVQQACDAATLAARKKLEGGTISGGVIPADVQEQADNFFDANFADGSYGSSNLNFTLTAGTDTRMDGTATVDVPTSLMGLFGYDKLDIAVNCSAELNLPNVDVLLVLDQSGSMNSGTRMEDLRQAVFAFYDEVEAVKPPGARIRIGVVPYSGAVNVGRILYDANPDWIADSWAYQTREAVFNEVVTPGEPAREPQDVRQVPKNVVERGDEIAPRKRYLVPYDMMDWQIPGVLENNNVTSVPGNSPLRWPTNNSAASNYCNDFTNSDGGEYIVGDELWVIDSDNYKSNHFTNGEGSKRGACDLRITRYEIDDPDQYRNVGVGDSGGSDGTEDTVTYVFSHYRHFQQGDPNNPNDPADRDSFMVDTSVFKTFASVQTPTGTQGAWRSSTWNGCIEERKTVATTDVTAFNPIPADALDLDINLVPDPANPDTQWKPQWPQITYSRQNRNNQRPDEYTTTNDRGTHSFNCPSPARRLQEYPSSGGARNPQFEAYINSLSPTGGTMHDIGMIWAGRFITPNGLFTADNTDAPNGDPISRHIIFMTDGEMGADPKNYTAYGNYSMDGRFMGIKGSGMWSEAETIPVNNARLTAVCNEIENEAITIWSVIFDPGASITAAERLPVKQCASGDNRAFETDDPVELREAFRKIAGSIAELRLVN